MNKRSEAIKTITCANCGGVFAADKPACPYCGVINPLSAEKAYMDELHDMRQTMEELGEEDERETGRALKRSGKRALKLMIILIAAAAVIGGIAIFINARRAAKDRSEYLWRNEMAERMEELYEAGDMDGLGELYQQESLAGHEVWRLPHFDLCLLLSEKLIGEDILSREADGLELSDSSQVLLLQCELMLVHTELRELTDEEREKLDGATVSLREDFKERFAMSEEDEAALVARMKERNGWLDDDTGMEYIRKRRD